MKKIAITDFAAKLASLPAISCKLPVSLRSVLSKAKTEDVRHCEFEGSFELSARDLESECIYISASGIGSGADLILNGKPIIASADVARSYLYSIKQLVAVGENKLTVRFKSASDRPLSVTDVGIFSQVSVMVFDTAAIDTVSVEQAHNGREVSLDVIVKVVGLEKSPRAVATLISPSGKMYYSGISHGKGRIKIPDPVLWNAGGGTASLYKLTVTLYSHDEADDIYESYIGLSDFSYKDDDGVLSFLHNGARLFALGAHIDCVDSVLCERSERDTADMIKKIADTGVNVLYVDGGEFCPSDTFYRMCDKYGMLVIRRLPPLSALSSDALAVHLMGFGDALKRIATHPSLVMLVCDNGDRSNYGTAINNTAPHIRLITSEALMAADGIRHIRSPLSLPPAESARRIFSAELPNVFSPRISGLADAERVVSLFGEISKNYLCPASYEGVAYASALASSDAVCEEILTAKFSEKLCTGATIDSIFDSIATASGSAMDCFGAKKALYYRMKRITGDVAIHAKQKNGEVVIRAMSAEDYSGRLNIRLCDSENRTVIEDTIDVSLTGGAVAEIYKRNFSDFINGMWERAYVAYQLIDGGRVDFSGSIRFLSAKEFCFLDPKIRSTVSGDGIRYEIDLVASAYAAAVELSFDGIDVELTDNFIDITENIPIRIFARACGESVSADKLASALRIKSVYDIGRTV